MRTIGVMVASDKAAILDCLCRGVSAERDLLLAARCRSIEDAVRLAVETKPAVVALDMGLAGPGCGAIHAIGNACGAAVVALGETAGNALPLLDAGASDFILIPVEGTDSDLRLFAADAVARLKIAALTGRNCSPLRNAPIRVIAAIAAQGGPVSLACFIKSLPLDCPPFVALQRNSREMSGADLLAKMTGRPVVEACDGLELAQGAICAADGRHVIEVVEAEGKLMLRQGNFGGSCDEAIENRLFQSLAELGGACAGITLSGDGLMGLKSLAARGGLAILWNKNALLRDLQYRHPGGLLELSLEDITSEVAARIRTSLHYCM